MSANQDYTVTKMSGLDPRLSAQLVKKAKASSSVVMIACNDVSIEANSLFKMSRLEVQPETVVSISAEGEDAEQVVSDLVKLLADHDV